MVTTFEASRRERKRASRSFPTRSVLEQNKNSSSKNLTLQIFHSLQDLPDVRHQSYRRNQHILYPKYSLPTEQVRWDLSAIQAWRLPSDRDLLSRYFEGRNRLCLAKAILLSPIVGYRVSYPEFCCIAQSGWR